MWHALLKQLFDGRAVGDLDMVGEPAAVVVDEEHLHGGNFLSGGGITTEVTEARRRNSEAGVVRGS